ncbi:SRPBCC family protein [Jatrophihabitans telluris]|uniref:SRPBCC family protein n=1 Tax=Jatrophihabitans telluris TaxID=2038343 RepID=A0ABY4QVA5_9ACTN|nr:SRPBCC family protein [Jatrophihabitans telluris]UQX87238.1 SRPBCC family protein [Jatrophihabitans telluris]
MRPEIHLIDDTWIAASPERVRAAVADPDNWARWWPSVTLRVRRDRGLKGLQWDAGGNYTGTVELWLEPVRDGVVLHHFLRLNPARLSAHPRVRDGGRVARRRARTEQRLAWHAKRVFWALKDDLEGR